MSKSNEIRIRIVDASYTSLMKRIKEFIFKRKTYIFFIISVIVLLQMLNYIRVFNTKTTPFIDEYLTCQYAHYYMGGEIGLLNREEMRYNEWIDINPLKESTYIDTDSSVFSYPVKDVIKQSVNKRTFFLYVNMLGRNTRDRHEWFRNVFILNLFLTLLTELFLYCIVYKLTDNHICSVLALVMWGFSGSVISYTTYVRFYVHVYFLCTLIVYMLLVMWTKKRFLYSIVGMILCHLCAYQAFRESEIVLFFYAVLVCTYTVALFVRRRIYEGIIYGTTSVFGGLFFLNHKTSFVDAFFHPNLYRGDKYSKLGDVLDSLNELSINSVKECAYTIFDNMRKYFWGARISAYILSLYFIVSLFVFIVCRLRESRDSATKTTDRDDFIVMMVIELLAFSTLMILAGLASMRHYHVIMSVYVIVVIYLAYNLVLYCKKYDVDLFNFSKLRVSMLLGVLFGIAVLYGDIKVFIRSDYEFVTTGGEALYSNLKKYSGTDAVFFMPEEIIRGISYYSFIDHIDWNSKVFVWEYSKKSEIEQLHDNCILYIDNIDQNARDTIDELKNSGYRIEDLGSDTFCSAYLLSEM